MRHNAEGVNGEKIPSHIEISVPISCRDRNFSVAARNITETPLCTERNYALSNIKCHPQKCQAPLTMERENWTRLQSFIPLLFCKSLVHTSYLKENPRPQCKCHSLCSDCREMTGQNAVLTEEWDCGAARFICALICKLCGFMDGCAISLNIVQQAAAQWILLRAVFGGEMNNTLDFH